jgi:hypothetical protein
MKKVFTYERVCHSIFTEDDYSTFMSLPGTINRANRLVNFESISVPLAFM